MSSDGSDPAFEQLLEYISSSRGFDFTGYKRPSLMRRIAKRMMMVGVHGFDQYVEYLDAHPGEFAQLFDTILINVTAFFRDPESWDYLVSEVVPRVMAGKRDGEPIRAWSAGCSSGEEPYSLAMALAEVMGPEAFAERVKIYATDVDDGALAKARLGIYHEREVKGISAHFLEKYFEPAPPEQKIVRDRFVFRKELRRAIIFGRHDLIQDPPISRVNILTCRNALMYLNTETQARIFNRFHFALNDRGFLFLGRAETMLTSTNTFLPVDLKRRVFAKATRGNLRDRLLAASNRPGYQEIRFPFKGAAQLHQAVFEASSNAQLVVDFGGLLALINERARILHGLSPADVGRPLQDLQISYRPADLRTCIDQAYAERVPVVLREVEWALETGEIAYFDIQVVPLIDPPGNLLGASVLFIDVTENRQLDDRLRTSTRELEIAYEELQSSNEELETTNEELQSSNEELETSNEELQSTNEEMETMNEELQSTNEELETSNQELRLRSEELNRSNSFLELILSSLRGGVAVLDERFVIQLWNPKAEDLWGLRAEEVQGKSFLGLDIGLPVDALRTPLQACLGGESELRELTLDATNRRGKAIRCRVTCLPMGDGDGVRGAILVMDDGEGSRPA